MPAKFLYVFLDEAGDFGFHTNGSKYFVLTSIAKERPFTIYQGFADLKYDLAESGLTIEYFYATEDKQAVRDKVYAVIQQWLASIRIDSLIVEKRKTNSKLREPEKFYSKMLGYLLGYVLKRFDLKVYSKLIFTDQLAVKRKREAVEKAIKTTLSAMLPGGAKRKKTNVAAVDDRGPAKSHIEYAKDENVTDLRNEASKKWASKVASITPYAVFPFI